MTNPVLARATPDRLVGRQLERVWLDDAFATAVAGAPTVRIVAGEAGIGKSRLVNDVLARHSDEWLIAVGNCVEAGEHGLPYAPVTGWLRDVARSDTGAELIEQLSAGSPGLLPLVDRGAIGTAEHATIDTTTGLDQLRLLDALTRLLEELANAGPTAVVIQDLQWADRSTLAFVSYLCRNLVPGPLVVVLTVRTDELHHADHLRALLGELVSLPVVRRIDLEPLATEEIAELLAGVRGAAVPRVAVSDVAARSGGNPFLAEQLLSANAEELLGIGERSQQPSPARAPSGHLADVLRRRLATLTPLARELTSVAALSGQTIDHEVLVSVSRRDEPDVVVAVHELVEHHLLEPSDDGRAYRFRHALVAEHAAGELLPVERRRLHARFADVLAGSDEPAVITRHLLGAGDLAGAFVSSHSAARAARSVAARSDEVAHWQRVLDLWEHATDDARADVGGETTAARLAAVAATEAGEINTAVALAERAVATAEHAGDRARARLVLAPLLTPVTTGSFEEIDVADAAVADAESANDASLIVDSRYLLARAYYHAGRFAEAASLADEIVEAADQLDKPAISLGASATAYLASAALEADPASPDPPQLRPQQYVKEQELVDAALTCDDAETALWVLTRLAEWWWPLDLHRAEHLGAQAYEYAARTGLRTSVRGVWARETLALCRMLNGNWDAVEALAHADPLPFNDLTAATLALETQVEIHRGKLDRGRRRLDLARRVSRDALGHGYVAIAALYLRLAEGDPEAAVAECVERLERLPPRTGYSDIEASLVARGVGALADAHEQGLDPPDGDELLAAADRIERRAREHPNPRHTDSPLAMLLAHRSRLEHSDPALWRRAVELRRERPFDSAVCRFHLAAALLTDGDATAAASELQSAADTFHQLGATLMFEKVKALAQRARLPLNGSASEEARPAGERWGLTDREQQVLALLAEGATNRAIGEELFISTKTVSVHVSNILSKLGAANRSEAAAIARRYGILS